MARVRLGTRGSLLAKTQAQWVASRIEELFPGLEVELVTITTRGDLNPAVPLPRLGEKGAFTQELEQALREKEIDLAVHSLKDLPVQLAAGLVLGAVPVREDPRDVLISREGCGLMELTPGARLGTCSLRRAAQLRRLRPDLVFVDLRGNVDTRLRKLEQGVVDGVVLAAAGLSRLRKKPSGVSFLPLEVCLPAPGQGALGVEARAEEGFLAEVCRSLDDPLARAAVTAERSFLAALGGGCQVPVAALASLEAGKLCLWGRVLSKDGSRLVEGKVWGDPGEADALGRELAHQLLARGAEEILHHG